MSDDGERTCPLCAEEMDLTDQQLKPCHCGYEICIWCWHHIIEMAEKDDTEARCPACRTPYDKDRVLKVAAATSERIIAEVYSEKKQRSHKTKAKISAEVMKHLSGVRVMQKNLVYVTGLPGNLCDESILERKEYFGQYGKVLKVSISRPAGTAPQKTFGVYITYAKEEEAVQCIQAAHNYVLEGKTLRACFGTTKYCRAWLRNLTCSNPDCLYLHDVGSQEDSFTKDETISAYTRSRVPQTTLNNSQRRSGNLLPPPVDDVSINGTGSDKHPVKGSSNVFMHNAPCQVKGSPPNSSLGKFNGLPAAASWGLRGLNCRITSNAQCSQTFARQNVETSKSSTLPSPLMKSPIQPSENLDEVITTSKVPERNVADAVLSPSEKLQLDNWLDSRLSKSLAAVFESDYPLVSAWDDDTIITPKPKEDREDLDDRSIGLDSIKLNTGRQQPTSLSHLPTQVVLETTDVSQVSSSCLSSPLVEALEDRENIIDLSSGEMMLRNSTMLKCNVRQLSNSDPVVVKHDSAIINGDVHSLVLGSSSDSSDSSTMKQINIGQHQTLASNLSSVVLTRSRDFNSEPVALNMGESSDWSNDPQGQQLISAMNEMDNPLKEQNHSLHSLNNQDNNTSHLSSTSLWNGLGNKQGPGGESSVDIDTNCSLGEQDSAVHNGAQIVDVCINSLSRNDSGSSEFNFNKESVRPLGRSATTNTVKDAFVDKTGESSIISDILSLDFDPWDESVSPANSLAKLLGETKKQDGSFSLSSSSRSATNNQSRFSFARQENQSSLLETPIGESNYVQKLCSSSQNSYQDSFYSDFQVNDYAGPSIDQNFDDSNRSGVSRAKIAVPPGFSAPSRAPPPGFSSQTRFNQTYDGAYSGENHYQSHSVSHSGDVEFIDPAILAVGKSRITVEPNNSTLGLKSSFPAQFVTSDNDPRFHLLSQQMISSHQNMRIPEMEETFWPLNDAFAASRLLAQSHTRFSPLAQLSHQQPRNPLYPNSHWDSWNNLHTVADMGMGDVFRNERIGLNDYYKSTPENKFHMPSASDLYSRAFGM
ncbi:uncharacterized protein LOC122015292 isoform X1 [Zingiber officinale]|uniref:uncharacterized protein LOC122015257 isoform X1 n=1 Tax=Zingiber officinale TaxID=94328 RepID=UPI001C4AC1C7|nr:uncharacterized protein LOC122015257 isoform X1 [Zingiber officinale]XP_042427989.1 uncharacterized protein LOC122015257 isoform X1 [Zingiber officinale]XP_042427993.1 uncharacterized protein LOC122015257 isoform X1 [Zingiber officinale]XP_042428001.1 uncharacterized protein LOC122015257 isoform X1 [Zingiber officinale]XP_042428040.1 uncharacterized protein LOC122015292 isoform X1 [Zingiber officinale]XP_042428048.1 uncharacterized protein LOC122015292 isoform X1 [Zingiber officinale]XP_04